MKIKPIVHVVKKGETLTSIAKDNRLPTYKYISNHPGNTGLMKERGSADKINTGDIILVPPSPVDSLRRQIYQLENLKIDTNRLHDQIFYEQQQAYQTANAWGQGVDAAASLINMARGLAGTISKATTVLSKSGSEFSKLWVEFMEEYMKGELKGEAENAVQKSSLMTEVSGEESMVFAFGKIIAQSYFDMTSPSYWAQRYTGVNIDEVHRNTNMMLESQRLKAMNSLDAKISQKRLQIMELSNKHGIEERIDSAPFQLY